MRAQSGDRLVVDVDGPREDAHRRTAVVTEVGGRDGTPPYPLRWFDAEAGHEVLVYPGSDARIEGGPGGR